VHKGTAHDQKLGNLLVRLLAAGKMQGCLAIRIFYIEVGLFEALQELEKHYIVCFDCKVKQGVLLICTVSET